MSKILVYAYRDWSFRNIEPALQGLDYIRWSKERDGEIDFRKFKLIITCEPHINGWRQTYPLVKGRIPILAAQQGLYWTNKPAKESAWLFDKYMVWGEQMKEASVLNGLEENRIIITGCPRFDKFFDMIPEDKGYTLVLGSGGEPASKFKDIEQAEDDIIIRLHPNMQEHRENDDLVELIRCARKVVFSYTGMGLIAMIMKKPVKIIPDEKKNYQKAFEMDRDAFVEWSVIDGNSIHRTRRVIEGYLQ